MFSEIVVPAEAFSLGFFEATAGRARSATANKDVAAKIESLSMVVPPFCSATKPLAAMEDELHRTTDMTLSHQKLLGQPRVSKDLRAKQDMKNLGLCFRRKAA
jgi:hypothetical protein